MNRSTGKTRQKRVKDTYGSQSTRVSSTPREIKVRTRMSASTSESASSTFSGSRRVSHNAFNAAPVSPGSNDKHLYDITNEIRKMKVIIIRQENRIRALEAALQARDEVQSFERLVGGGTADGHVDAAALKPVLENGFEHEEEDVSTSDPDNTEATKPVVENGYAHEGDLTTNDPNQNSSTTSCDENITSSTTSYEENI